MIQEMKAEKGESTMSTEISEHEIKDMESYIDQLERFRDLVLSRQSFYDLSEYEIILLYGTYTMQKVNKR